MVRKLLLLAVLPVIFISLSTAALAEGKATVDPNKARAGVARASDEDMPETDSRLSKKITYEARRKTVSAIMSDLAELTGITFKAGLNDSDWQVRDRKMNIFAKDTTIASIMNGISHVMKFKWRIAEKDNVRTYRIYMDRKTLLDAENARLRDEQRAEEEQAEKRQKSLEELGKTFSMSPRELAKLKETNPYAYMVATSDVGKSIGSFFGSVPAVTEAIASGQEMMIGGSSLSPAGQQGLIGAIKSMAKLEATFTGKTSPNLPPDLEGSIGNATIRVNSMLDMVKNQPMGNVLLGEIQIDAGNQKYGLPFLDPDSNFAKMIGKAMIKSQEQQRPISDVLKEMGDQFLPAMMADFKQDTSGEQVIEHAEDPALTAKIKMQAKGGRIDDIQAALAEASQYAVVSDSFTRSSMPLTFPKEIELKEALDKMAESWHYNWDKRPTVIEMRDRNWYKKRAAQIPEAWLEQWRQAYKKNGTLDIDDLGNMANLTFEQFNMNIVEDDTLRMGTTIPVIFGNRDLLRFYSSLTDSQISTLFTDSGLGLSTLTPEQWPLAQKLINAQNSAFLKDAEAKITLTAARKQNKKVFDYKFKAVTTDDLRPIEWSFTTPEYVEPPKPPAKQGEEKKDK